jgi:hypothetical protein
MTLLARTAGSSVAPWCAFASIWTTCCRSLTSQPCAMIETMSLRRTNKAKNEFTDRSERERIIQVLSLEYQTLMEEILLRTSGRFQFLGLMTTAAALLSTGVFGHPVFRPQTWIAAALAAGVFIFGVACFVYLGRQRELIAFRVGALEKRINALLSAEPGFPAVLSWNSGYKHVSLYQKIRITLHPSGADATLRQ